MQLSEEFLGEPNIFYSELLVSIINKNIWQITECDECMELLLSRKNSIMNVVECVVKVVKTLVVEESVVTIQQLYLTTTTLKSLNNSKWTGSV
jgi:hypothetical protein